MNQRLVFNIEGCGAVGGGRGHFITGTQELLFHPKTTLLTTNWPKNISNKAQRFEKSHLILKNVFA